MTRVDSLFSLMHHDRDFAKLGNRGTITLSGWRTMLIKRCAVVLLGPCGGGDSPFIGGPGASSRKF